MGYQNPTDQMVKLPAWSSEMVLAQANKKPLKLSLSETGGTTSDMQSRCKPSCFGERLSLTVHPPTWPLHPRTVPGMFNLLA